MAAQVSATQLTTSWIVDNDLKKTTTKTCASNTQLLDAGHVDDLNLAEEATCALRGHMSKSKRPRNVTENAPDSAAVPTSISAS